MPDFDVVLYGATGFTGQQCVHYFSQHAPAGLRWAIAGRDQYKLDQLNAGVPALVADCSDQASIDSFVRRTAIVLSTAGPFELYSDGVVDACVRFGVHYVDITGETLWVRSLIDRHQERATANGTRIIPFCGFDSVPADLGALFVAEQLGDAAEVKAYYEFAGGAPNGGTVATGFHLASSGKNEKIDDPFLLAPLNRMPLPLEIDPAKAFYDGDVRAWVMPFIMGAINTRVVRRSCALLDLPFTYQEYAKTKGAVHAYAGNAAVGLLKRSLNSHPLRRALQRLSPAPGSGPSEKAMDQGWFRCEFFAHARDGRTARARVSGQGDPANRITVKCVCESALTLACDSTKLPDRAGILTPSTGLGRPLRDRLMKAGLHFESLPTA